MNFYEELRKQRESQHLTLDQAAERLHLSVPEYRSREDAAVDLNFSEKCGLLVGLGMKIERALAIAAQPEPDSDGIRASLPEDEEILRGIFEFAPDPILLVGGDGKILRVNQQTEKAFGYNRQELLNQPVEILIPDKFRMQHVSQRDAYSASPHIRSMGSGLNFHGKRNDGSEFPVDVMLSPMGNTKGRITIAIVRDITEQKEMEEAIMLVSEKEKRRIGLEIHDDLCQDLVAVTLMSNALHERLTGKNLEEQEDSRRIVELLREVNIHARSLARGLSVIDLTGGSFNIAVEKLAARFSRLTKIECCCETNMPVDFSNNIVATHLFRIIQQAVNNAVTHAGASRIAIRVVTNDNIIVTVEDNGAGIPEPLPVNRGTGLKIMRYRAQLIGAGLSVRRREQGGTEVLCSLPPNGMAVIGQ
jgi:PAS domain S-box-containing protein